MSRRTSLTEVGPDSGALRIQDRDGVLFDLGLGTLQIDACIRVSDPDVVAALRGRTGKSVFAPENDLMRILLAANPHRVFISRIARAEVFQPIPPPGGRSPDGPHTHVLPKLLAHGRTHAATELLPDGWIPCAHLYPAHPLHDQLGRKRTFRREHHAAFQALLERYGVPELVALKQQVVEAVTAGRDPTRYHSRGTASAEPPFGLRFGSCRQRNHPRWRSSNGFRRMTGPIRWMPRTQWRRFTDLNRAVTALQM